jgi:hypothetical protein
VVRPQTGHREHDLVAGVQALEKQSGHLASV